LDAGARSADWRMKQGWPVESHVSSMMSQLRTQNSRMSWCTARFVLYHGFLSDCPTGHWCGEGPTATGVVPAFYAGGRYAFSETTSLAMRVGYPTISVGLSFL
jgi:hypothetical protein